MIIQIKDKKNYISIKAQQEKEARDKESQELIELEEPEAAPVYSIYEIMNTFERQDDGSIILPLLTIEDSPKVFESQEEYEEWLVDRKQAILEQTRKNLSPHEFYITQGKSMERPYANDYWWVKDVGTYS